MPTISSKPRLAQFAVAGVLVAIVVGVAMCGPSKGERHGVPDAGNGQDTVDYRGSP